MSDHFYGVPMAGEGRSGHTAWAAYGPADASTTPVVLVHSLGDSGACWPGVVEHLAENRLVLVVDLRGHGGSALPQEPLTVQAMADDVAVIVRSVLRRPAVVVGHSLGGLVALDLAVRAWALTAGLVVEDPVLDLGTGETGAADVTRTVEDLLGWARSTSYVAMITAAREQNPAWADDEFSAWAQAKKELDPRLAEVAGGLAGRDWYEALALVAPEREFGVTVVAGDPERGSLVSIADGARVAELLADRGRVVRLDAGHCIRRDQRAAFLELLDEALPD